ncbi:MAG: TetR family transcriptional regulator [Kocuria sp.]|nr:TetR family transcriptional regulator [Kocuria sp.]
MSLTREHIVEAALKVAGDYGLGDLSMRRVATELNVHAGALYWHVANKQELLIAVAHRILDPNHGAAAWPDEPAHVLTDFRNRLLAVRDGADIVAVAHAHQPTALPPTPLLVQQWETRGFDNALPRACNLVRWVLGSVLAQQTALNLAAASTSTHKAAATLTAQFDQDFQRGLTTLLPFA